MSKQGKEAHEEEKQSNDKEIRGKDYWRSMKLKREKGKCHKGLKKEKKRENPCKGRG